MTMTQIRHDLWETAPFSPFDPVTTHAYLWTPTSGENVLFYAPGDETDFEQLAELGGIGHQYLSHQDEAGPALQLVADRFGLQLHAPAAERDAVARFAEPDVLYEGRAIDGTGVEVIPTPGHTPGSTSFVVSPSDGVRYLFTGDTLFVDRDGNWRAGYIPGYSELDPLSESLELLASLRPTLVASSAFGATGVSEVDPDDWADQVHHALDTLTAA